MENNQTGHADYITVDKGAEYAAVSKRTFLKWLRNGLKHVRVTKKTVRTRYPWIDEYLAQFQEDRGRLDRIVEEVMRDFAASP